ncbi:hypothetical protein FRD01_08425 [Microvenator marinus]|uniref:Type IV pilus assembly protein PilM n=1 Tax=Microvenator marinus TaxID=2600177 RepID=A0A5B8XUB5_9DELT|nr:cell division protein FtsA [Microvenator marinus]QED27266.1 hypothetical protein FRD01_08425 [Microvenator marinus]
MAKRIIAIDIGAWSVKARVMDVKDNLEIYRDEIRLASFGSTVSPEEADTQTEAPDGAEAVEEAAEVEIDLSPLAQAFEAMAIHIQPSKDDAWVVTMAGTQAMLLFVGVPFGEKPKVASVLPNILVDLLPFPIAEVISDFFVETIGETHQAVVGITRRSQLSAFLEDLKSGGVDPAKVVPPELAMAVGAKQFVGTTDVVAVLDIGHQHTRVVVLQERRLLHANTILIGGQRITAEIAKAFRASTEEAENAKHQYAQVVQGPQENPQVEIISRAVTDALRPMVRDLRRSLQALYAKSGAEVQTVFITGGTAKIRGLDAWLTRELGVEARKLPLPSNPVSLPLYGASLALNDKEKLLNLRQGAFAFKGSSPYLRKQAAIFGFAAVIFAILIAANLFLQKASQEARRDAMKATLEAQTKKVFGEALSSQSDIQSRIEGGAASGQAFIPKMSAFELLYQVTNSVSPEIEMNLTRLEVDIDRKIIQLMGETSDAQAVDQIVSDLERLECLQNIKKDKLRVKNDGKADFELQIASECS